MRNIKMDTLLDFILKYKTVNPSKKQSDIYATIYHNNFRISSAQLYALNKTEQPENNLNEIFLKHRLMDDDELRSLFNGKPNNYNLLPDEWKIVGNLPHIIENLPISLPLFEHIKLSKQIFAKNVDIEYFNMLMRHINDNINSGSDLINNLFDTLFTGTGEEYNKNIQAHINDPETNYLKINFLTNPFSANVHINSPALNNFLHKTNIRSYQLIYNEKFVFHFSEGCITLGIDGTSIQINKDLSVDVENVTRNLDINLFTDMMNIFDDFVANPLDFITRRYEIGSESTGELTSRCCVCNRKLTAHTSVINSIGPICKKKLQQLFTIIDEISGRIIRILIDGDEIYSGLLHSSDLLTLNDQQLFP